MCEPLDSIPSAEKKKERKKERKKRKRQVLLCYPSSLVDLDWTPGLGDFGPQPPEQLEVHHLTFYLFIYLLFIYFLQS
jgi:hypothetical protein